MGIHGKYFAGAKTGLFIYPFGGHREDTLIFVSLTCSNLSLSTSCWNSSTRSSVTFSWSLCLPSGSSVLILTSMRSSQRVNLCRQLSKLEKQSTDFNSEHLGQIISCQLESREYVLASTTKPFIHRNYFKQSAALIFNPASSSVKPLLSSHPLSRLELFSRFCWFCLHCST